AGNLITGSPIGDSLPPLMVLDATLTLVSTAGQRVVKLNDFYTGYRQSLLRPDELLAFVEIPLPASDDLFKLYKVSNRADMDISTFSAAIWMRLRSGVIDQARIACGGVGQTVLRLRKAEQRLQGRAFDPQTVDEVSPLLLEEITPITDVRGSSDYRNLLAANLLRRLYAESAVPAISGNGNERHF
ncbi:MAG TPA: FAD binding domain-containing protein, partial [Tepidisphaeraceae bacterium]